MQHWIAPQVDDDEGDRVKIREMRFRGGHNVFTETLAPDAEVSIQLSGILVLGTSDTAEKDWPRIDAPEPGEYRLRGGYLVGLLDDQGKEVVVRDRDGTKTVKYTRLTSGTVTFHSDSQRLDE